MSKSMKVCTFGVEEELLLVDAEAGTPLMENTTVAGVAESLGLDLDIELTACQIETTSPVLTASADLRHHIITSRRTADSAARRTGGRALACALPPIAGRSHAISETTRYRRLATDFGFLAHEQGVCGCHVHVEVPSREEGIEVINRARRWLPTLVALTANSAVHNSSDTGYSSWRTILWSRWPTADVPPHFGSASSYDTEVARLLDIGAALDEGMVYWDIRYSARYGTVEFRVADVPATADETTLYATLVRALVMTELSAIDRAVQAPETIDSTWIRLSKWRAARDGITGFCPDPLGNKLIDTRGAVDHLVRYVSDALDVLGDQTMVTDTVDRVFAAGNGAVGQRGVLREYGIDALLDRIAARTITDTL